MLAYDKNIQHCIRHCDPSLPNRIRDFAQNIIHDNRGLWGTNPPKTLADVVEALIGAVHVEQGFDAGQKTSKRVLSSVTSTILSNINPASYDLQEKASRLMHPKQVMKHLKMYLTVKACREDTFLARFPNELVWFGDHWEKPNPYGNGSIGHVTCCGVNIVAVLDRSSSLIAKNRACALAVNILKQKPQILDDLDLIVMMLKPENSTNKCDEDAPNP